MKHCTLRLLLAVSLLAATAHAQDLKTLTPITGTNIDPANDYIPVIDESADGIKELTFAELVNVSSFTTAFAAKASLTGAETLTNKTLTSPVLTAPVLGTPASGNFSTGTFTWPTFNQNTTGNAATVTTINGRIAAGTNVTITGSGTAASPYSISASGGGGSVDEDGDYDWTGTHDFTAATTSFGTFTTTSLTATSLTLGATAITASGAEINFTDGVTSAIQTQLDAKAALASPTLTGNPLAPTATAGDTDTSIATTAFVTEGKTQKLFIEKHASSHTLTAAECYGGVYYITGAGVVLTLPAAADGMSITVICTTANVGTIDANASDLILLDGTALDDGDSIDSGGTAGEICVLTYYDATGWYAATDGWVDGGP